MTWIRLHDLNNPNQEVLIDVTMHFNVVPNSAGMGSILLFTDGPPIYVHESRDEIETLVEEE